MFHNDQYPDLDSCRRFIIEEKQGKFQATCGYQHSTFSFQIEPKFLAGALDRFGAMFKEPEFLEIDDDFVEEQKKEQHEYNEKRKEQEDERFWHLMR